MKTMSAMTTKERWLAAIRLQPPDRLPFWPKLDNNYPAAQPAPFRDMKLDELHEWIGSDRHEWISPCVREARKKTSVEVVKTGKNIRTTVYHTPIRDLKLAEKYDAPSGSWHPVSFPVQTLDDIRLMTEFIEDGRIEPDENALAKTKRHTEQWGWDVLTCVYAGTSPLMQWVEWFAGVEAAHYLLADHEKDVEALFDAWHGANLRLVEHLVGTSPADVFYLVENTSTTLISPEQYRKYCAPRITEYGNMTRAAGRILLLHMCGHLKDILPDLAPLPVDGFEAFTSPTLGNTTLLDGRTACPDKCLIGGTNAMLWTRPAGEIIARMEADLNALPHHRGLVMTSAGVMPPACLPETIKEVCAWVKRYPAVFGA